MSMLCAHIIIPWLRVTEKGLLCPHGTGVRVPPVNRIKSGGRRGEKREEGERKKHAEWVATLNTRKVTCERQICEHSLAENRYIGNIREKDWPKLKKTTSTKSFAKKDEIVEKIVEQSQPNVTNPRSELQISIHVLGM